MPIPSPCKPLSDEIDELKREVRDLQAELQMAPTPRKSGLVRQIKHLNALIAAKQPALDACFVQYNGPLPPQPIAATFAASLAITTNNSFTGEPFTAAATLGLVFDGPRTTVFVRDFVVSAIDTTSLANELTGLLKIFFGPNITTITRPGGGNGSYDKASGHLVLPNTLHFDQSRDAPFFEEDSNLSITLSTLAPGGAPVDAAGQITLVGFGTFSSGILNGVGCRLILSGTLSPVP